MDWDDWQGAKTIAGWDKGLVAIIYALEIDVPVLACVLRITKLFPIHGQAKVTVGITFHALPRELSFKVVHVRQTKKKPKPR